MANSTSTYKYQTKAGSIFKVRMDNDAVLDTIRGIPPTTAYTENMTVRVSKNSKEAGIQPRYTLFGRVVGTASASVGCLIDTGVRYKYVVSLTETAFNAIVTGPPNGSGVTSFTQNGKTFWALDQSPEDIE